MELTPQREADPLPIDPLLRRRVAASLSAQLQSAPPNGPLRGRHPYPQRRTLRIAGAAGMSSLLALTGYITAGASGSPARLHRVADPPAPSPDPPAPSPDPPAPSPDTVAALPAGSEGTSTSAAPPAPACTTTYTVASGDFWIRIAAEASLPVEALYAVNNATAHTPLFPGQIVCLPDGAVVVVTAPAPSPASAPARGTTVPVPVTTSPPPVTTPKPKPKPAPPAPVPNASSGSS